MQQLYFLMGLVIGLVFFSNHSSAVPVSIGPGNV